MFMQKKDYMSDNMVNLSVTLPKYIHRDLHDDSITVKINRHDVNSIDALSPFVKYTTEYRTIININHNYLH